MQRRRNLLGRFARDQQLYYFVLAGRESLADGGALGRRRACLVIEVDRGTDPLQ